MLACCRCLSALCLLILVTPLVRADDWAVRFAPNPVYGGDSVTGTLIRMPRPWAPAEVFTVTCSTPDLVTMPQQVVLNEGWQMMTFTVGTQPVAVQTGVTITTSDGYRTSMVTLTLMPLALKEITMQRPRAVGGHGLTGTLHLYGQAPAGGLPVALRTSDATKATVPPEVVVPEGARSVDFPIMTSLQYGVGSVTLTADWNGQVSAMLVLVPPPRYLVEDVSPRPDGRAIANAIAENGDVAGYTIADGYQHGFLFKNGTPTVLGLLSGNNSTAWGLNAFGQVVGGSDRPFLWRDGTFEDLGGLGATMYGSQLGTAYGVNDAGDVVGESFAGPSTDKGYHPFYKPYGKPMLDLVPAALEGRAEEINNGGNIVGRYWLVPDGKKIAFRAHVDPASAEVSLESKVKEGWDVCATDVNEQDVALVVMENALAEEAINYLWAPDGTLRELPLGRQRGSMATALNDNGEIVGGNVVPGTPAVAFPFHLAPDGTIINLNDAIDPASGWNLFPPADINNAGQIVGTGTLGGVNTSVPSENYRAYRLTPLLPSDIDRNGVTDLLDVVAALRIVAGIAPAPPFGIGDLDADQRVTLIDVARIARLVAMDL